MACGRQMEGVVSDRMGNREGEKEFNSADTNTEEELLVHLTKEAVMGMEFATLEDVENFYRKYACVRGFGVQLDDIYKNRHGEAQSRKIFCSCEGKTGPKMAS